MTQDTTLLNASGSTTGASAVSVEQQRQAMQSRIEALRESGALPTAPTGDVTASVAQWTNWSNG